MDLFCVNKLLVKASINACQDVGWMTSLAPVSTQPYIRRGRSDTGLVSHWHYCCTSLTPPSTHLLTPHTCFLIVVSRLLIIILACIEQQLPRSSTVKRWSETALVSTWKGHTLQALISSTCLQSSKYFHQSVCMHDWQQACVFNLRGVVLTVLWVWWAPATDITRLWGRGMLGNLQSGVCIWGQG